MAYQDKCVICLIIIGANLLSGQLPRFDSLETISMKSQLKLKFSKKKTPFFENQNLPIFIHNKLLYYKITIVFCFF